MIPFYGFIDRLLRKLRIKDDKERLSFFDHVTWLHSLSTNKLFPTIIFTADTDIVTMGWICLTSTNGNELVMTQQTSEEFSNTQWAKLVETRVNMMLSRQDFRYVHLIEMVGKEVFFTDIYDPKGTASVEKVITTQEFENNGGIFHILD